MAAVSQSLFQVWGDFFGDIAKGVGNFVQLEIPSCEYPEEDCLLNVPDTLFGFIPHQQIAAQIGNVKVGKKIGSGCFGDVYEMVTKKWGKVAFKVGKCVMGVVSRERLEGELETIGLAVKGAVIPLAVLLRAVDGNFHVVEKRDLLRFEGAALIGVFTDLIEGGKELYDVIEERSQKMQDKDLIIFSHAEIRSLARHVMTQMADAHSQNIIHRDLNNTNILYDPRRNIYRVIDFGQAKNYASHRSNSMVGTPAIRAPEIYLGTGSQNDKVDVWSFGIQFFTATFGFAPFSSSESSNFMDLGRIIERYHHYCTDPQHPERNFVSFVKDHPQFLGNEWVTSKMDEMRTTPEGKARLDLMSKLLAANPKDRPTMAEALQHPFMTNLF